MSDRIEIQGKTVEDAVSEALLQMGARRDEVEIKVLQEPKSGFMGFLGGRAARVLVRKKQSGRNGGRGQDHRVDDGDYQAHNLGSGRSRGGSRRQSSGDAPKERVDSRQASRQPEREDKREEKGGSRRGSRGRGGRGRGSSQEATGRDQRPDQRSNQRPDQRQDQKPPQRENQASGRKSAARRGRNGDGDSRQENRTQPPREPTRPVQRTQEDSAPREETPIRPLRQEPVQAQTAPAAPVVREEPSPLTQKKETPVTKPPKTRRSFGGLGIRLKEKRVAAKAAEAPNPASDTSREVSGPSPVNSTPVDSTQRTALTGSSRSARPAPDRMTREHRGPSFRSAPIGEELILGGIKGTQYAQKIGSVTEEGLDDALTELTDAMLARAGFPCRCETFPGEYRMIKVTTDEASAGMLIGRHGQTVEAVEHLVERMASNAIDARARINLDINNYRMRREELLGERVAEAAEKIRETGRPIHLEPMSGRERRIVHMETAALGGLRTFTMEGSGGKHVVIAPEEESSQEAENQEAASPETEGQAVVSQETESTVDGQEDSAEELDNSNT